MKIQLKTQFWDEPNVDIWKDKYMNLMWIFGLYNIIYASYLLYKQSYWMLIIPTTGICLFLIAQRSKVKYEQRRKA